MTLLKDLLPADFLRTYWQKKPLLIRQALPGYISPLAGEELAGLALDSQVESRLVIEQGSTPWELKSGPFTEEDFGALPSSHWTLLVQAVDHWVPEIADLMNHFDFIPRWRLDDIMISYAPEGGSVGPHYDQYDVFLLQGQGQRKWQIGALCDDQTENLSGTKLRILKEFEALEEHILEPGDMLYLPPGYAHWGVALNECQTISIGFRAPSHADIAAEFGQFVSEQLQDSQRYSDHDLSPPVHPGLIDDAAVARVQQILQGLMTPERIGRWLGRYMTEPKYLDQNNSPLRLSLPAIKQALADGMPLAPALSSRFAYKDHWLFVDSREYPLAPELLPMAQHLASGLAELDGAWLVQQAEQNPQALQLLVDLVNQGSLQLLENEETDDQELDW